MLALKQLLDDLERFEAIERVACAYGRVAGFACD
jgi:hypothetical protein